MIFRLTYLKRAQEYYKWVRHGLNIGVLGLSMQVYGRDNRYVINMLGKSVMVEQTEKERLNLLPQSYWSRYYVECDIASRETSS